MQETLLNAADQIWIFQGFF